MTRRQLYTAVVERFEQQMPVAQTELHYSNPFELLCAVILSAQCTDKRVNLVTPALFEAFPTPQALAQATADTLFPYISSVSYPNNKTRSLLGMARELTERFGGQVPDDMDSLLSLPGVGRKTANVMLSVVWGKPAMAVDTHVFRVSRRLGLTPGCDTPLQTEEMLCANIAQDKLAIAHHWLILHGRYVCKARKPMCQDCFLQDLCKKCI